VDYDPIVLSHAQALLTSTPEGQTDYIKADLRDTDTILKGAARTLDLTRPVAVLLIAVDPEILAEATPDLRGRADAVALRSRVQIMEST